LRIPVGLTHVPGSSSHRLGIHFGRPVNADCRCDGRRHRRVQKHGDIDIVPAGLDGSWEDDADCSILRLRVSPALLRQAAQGLCQNPDSVAITPKFQLRDAQIEAIGCAIKAELEAEAPSDRLYAEALGLALAVRLLEIGDQPQRETIEVRQTLSPRRRRLLLEFIETHLDQSLSLSELAAIAGLSVSHLKTLFRNTFGKPAHQYIVRRRVGRAQALLLSSEIPMSQIALEAGFADQSHMANCMRRVLGLTPGAIAHMRS
jgi:AraC family transcriptional regulator